MSLLQRLRAHFPPLIRLSPALLAGALGGTFTAALVAWVTAPPPPHSGWLSTWAGITDFFRSAGFGGLAAAVGLIVTLKGQREVREDKHQDRQHELMMRVSDQDAAQELEMIRGRIHAVNSSDMPLPEKWRIMNIIRRRAEDLHRILDVDVEEFGELDHARIAGDDEAR